MLPKFFLSLFFVFFMENFLIWLLFPLIANMLTSSDTCCSSLLNFNADQRKRTLWLFEKAGCNAFQINGERKAIQGGRGSLYYSTLYAAFLIICREKNEMRIAPLLISFHYYLLICIQVSQKKYL